MKLLHVGLVLAVSFCLICQLSAKVVVTNDSEYEVKAIVEWAGGRGGWDCFPGGSIRKEKGKFVLDDSKPGMLRHETYSTGKDWSDIKKYWAVWAKIDGIWQPAPSATPGVPLTSHTYAYGGLITAVKAVITSDVDDNGNPIFYIAVETGA